MLFILTTILSQQNLSKHGTNGVFTEDKRFLDQLLWKISQQFEIDFCCLYRQSTPLNKKRQIKNCEEKLHNFC